MPHRSDQEDIASIRAALLGADYVTALALLRRDGDGSGLLARIEQQVVPALDDIGDAWGRGEVSLAEVYISGRLCERLIDDVLREANVSRRAQPKMAIAALDDYHLLGKRLVHASLRAAGYEVADHGRGTAEEIVRRAADEEIEVLLISVLMLPSALRVAEVRSGLAQRGLPTKVVVGGAPFRLDPDLWRQVGADASGPTAACAVSLVDTVWKSSP
ncbi:MAG: cobalamin B12-binding domain-containing protein [Armatimonadetes bacterium]|nr:cobalamin B12-binding domain-containing protein [Armatimonadota bacterium]